MYKLLLCWRYLLTRYLAFACIISVMLGVATLIVVNSVMSGFSTKLQDRLHALLGDLIIDAVSIEGFSNPEKIMAQVRSDEYLNERVQVMAPTLEIFAMMQFQMLDGQMNTRTVRLIGVDPKSRAQLGGFTEYLQLQQKSPEVSFKLPEEARANYLKQMRWLNVPEPVEPQKKGEPPPPAPTPNEVREPSGAIVGKLIVSMRYKEKETDEKYKDLYHLRPGDTFVLTTLSGARMMPVFDRFMVVDYFQSEMSEYDSSYVFVPLDYLQHLRTMEGRVTSIQIKLKPGADPEAVKERLKAVLSGGPFQVVTWKDKQSPLLAAIAIEKGILNVLLFMIVGVAGFGILSIFSMIVAEKTRDIGILKALGASNVGVMKIFLTYGLLLGLVGTGLGTLLGMTLTIHINDVEQFLSSISGQEIFDRKIYYFTEIPTDIQFLSVMLVNIGAVAIAVIFSVLPALRAAMLHPVRALRYE